MGSLTQKFYIDAAGGYLGSWTGFKHPDEFLRDREGAVILFDTNGVPADAGEPLLVREGLMLEPALPARAIEVPFPPADGRAKWDGTKWIEPPPPAPQLDPAAFMRLAIAKGLVTEPEIRAEMETKGKA